MVIGNSSHKTKQSRSKLAQDLEKTRVRESSSPPGKKIPQLWVILVALAFACAPGRDDSQGKESKRRRNATLGGF
jgi:hypothetical protein